MARRTLQGIWTPKNPEKYLGNSKNIVFRSSWERTFMRWCDDNPSVLKYSSEETIVPYICKTDNKTHRYFVDFYVEFKSGLKYLIEIKPESQTKVPKRTKRKKEEAFLNEVMTYAKNTSKWEAANVYAKNRGMIFEVWTETMLNRLGVRVK